MIEFSEMDRQKKEAKLRKFSYLYDELIDTVNFSSGGAIIGYLTKEEIKYMRERIRSNYFADLIRIDQKNEHDKFIRDLFQRTPDQIRLMAGEMMDQEMTAVCAVLSGLYAKYRSNYEENEQ
jgi:hypothetical protein